MQAQEYHEVSDVSIPHRYARNQRRHLCMAGTPGVSIPHRYARNDIDIANITSGEIVFQFLIGTLETFLANTIGSFAGLFQFLIGTLETLSKTLL